MSQLLLYLTLLLFVSGCQPAHHTDYLRAANGPPLAVAPPLSDAGLSRQYHLPPAPVIVVPPRITPPGLPIAPPRPGPGGPPPP